MRATGFWLASALSVMLLAAPATAAEGRSVTLLAGVFNIGKTPTEGEAGLEVRLAPRRWGLRPAFGVSGNEEGALWGWAGLALDVDLAPRWYLIPGFAVAAYDEGDSKDLGGPLEFRSSLELAYRSSARSRIGVAVYHLSNAGIEKPNPGSNSAVVTLTFLPGR